MDDDKRWIVKIDGQELLFNKGGVIPPVGPPARVRIGDNECVIDVGGRCVRNHGPHLTWHRGRQSRG